MRATRMRVTKKGEGDEGEGDEEDEDKDEEKEKEKEKDKEGDEEDEDDEEDDTLIEYECNNQKHKTPAWFKQYACADPKSGIIYDFSK